MPPQASEEYSEQLPCVHTGFLLAYQSIAHRMLDILGRQIESHPTYSVIATGESYSKRVGLINFVNMIGHSLGVSSYTRNSQIHFNKRVS